MLIRVHLELAWSSFSRINYFHHWSCGCSEIPKILPHWVCAGVCWIFVIDTWFSRVSVKFVKFADIHPQSRHRWDRCELQPEPHKWTAGSWPCWIRLTSAGPWSRSIWVWTLSDPAGLCWTLGGAEVDLDSSVLIVDELLQSPWWFCVFAQRFWHLGSLGDQIIDEPFAYGNTEETWNPVKWLNNSSNFSKSMSP